MYNNAITHCDITIDIPNNVITHCVILMGIFSNFVTHNESWNIKVVCTGVISTKSSALQG